MFALLVLTSGCREGSNIEPSNDSIGDALEYRDGAYLWRPSRITLTFEEGSAIRLDQSLPEDEMGWTMSRMDVPSTWKITNLRFEGLAMCFSNQHGENFSIQPPRLNKLDFAIGGIKEDDELEVLWRTYALAQ